MDWRELEVGPMSGGKSTGFQGIKEDETLKTRKAK